MAALIHQRTEATYEVHETIKVDTQDHEDHTFCGIMFPIQCKNLLPLHHIVIRSVSVRGYLGPMTVWVNHNDDTNLQPDLLNRNNSASVRFSSESMQQTHWTKVYEKVHTPSMRQYQRLEFDTPIIMKPGDIKAIYIHSTLPNDKAIVYDNASRNWKLNNHRYNDEMITISRGRAHVSHVPFGQVPIWGWGHAWRDHREFVGQIEYGALYQLWNPIDETRCRFGPKFTKAVYTLFMCQRKWESPISRLPDECLFYILHMCRWDWFDDSKKTMSFQQYFQQEQDKKRQKRRLLEKEQQQLIENNNNLTKSYSCMCTCDGTNNMEPLNRSATLNSDAPLSTSNNTASSRYRRSLSRLHPKRILKSLSNRRLFSSSKRGNSL